MMIIPIVEIAVLICFLATLWHYLGVSIIRSFGN